MLYWAVKSIENENEGAVQPVEQGLRIAAANISTESTKIILHNAGDCGRKRRECANVPLLVCLSAFQSEPTSVWRF